MAIHTYKISELSNFVEGFELALNQGFTSRNRTDFFTKFCQSLQEAVVLAQSSAQNKWNRKDAMHYHTWLSYNKAGDVIIFNPKREDEWSNGLLSDALKQYSTEYITEWNNFTESEEYTANMDLACDFYDRSGSYFSRIVSKHRSGEKVSKNEYNRIVENKYIMKVRNAMATDPIFDVGALVDFRTNHNETNDVDGRKTVWKRAPLGLLVLSNSEPIVSTCIGCRRYKVVPVGDSQPFWTEERYLKKRKKRK